MGSSATVDYSSPAGTVKTKSMSKRQVDVQSEQDIRYYFEIIKEQYKFENVPCSGNFWIELNFFSGDKPVDKLLLNLKVLTSG